LEGVALLGATAHLMLEAPPMDRSVHALEVCTPNREPLVLYAQPLGPPTATGFPLRLSLTPPANAAGQQPSSLPPTAVSRDPHQGKGAPPAPRRKTVHTLTEGHTTDLASEPKAREEMRAERMIGRQLAGGKLLIEASVGKGGAGAVYRARHRDLGHAVAVKVMHESFQRDIDYCRRFHAEALAASRLDQANLTRVLDYGQEPDGLLYMAMEFLDGRSLRDVLRVEKRMELARATRLMIQVCTGLTHAHARNVVHRDIKPENLMLVRGLDDDGNDAEIVKVCDFGIAQASNEASSGVAGTPEYMAPEQFGKEELDARVDVYACGIVFYELLTGDLPIKGATMLELRARIAVAIPEPPSRKVPGLDPRVDAIIARALAKDRGARYPTMRDLRADLRALLSGAGYGADIEPSSPGLQAPRVSAAMTASVLGAPASSPDAPGPEWLERGTARFSQVVDSVPPSADLGRAVAPLLRQLAEMRDPTSFALFVPHVEQKLRAAAELGYADAVWRIRSTLATIAAERPNGPGTRAILAEQLLRVIPPCSRRSPSARSRARRATPTSCSSTRAPAARTRSIRRASRRRIPRRGRASSS
jgi:serine/threonine-protein kinase